MAGPVDYEETITLLAGLPLSVYFRSSREEFAKTLEGVHKFWHINTFSYFKTSIGSPGVSVLLSKELSINWRNGIPAASANSLQRLPNFVDVGSGAPGHDALVSLLGCGKFPDLRHALSVATAQGSKSRSRSN